MWKKRPMTWRAHVLSWLDDQISVKSSFWNDLKWLVWLPAWPFALIAWIWFDTSIVRQVAIGTGFIFCLAGTVLIFQRRRIKKRDWVEPSRYSDENGGY